MERGDSNLLGQISTHVAKGLEALNGGSVLAGTLEHRLLHHSEAFKASEREEARATILRARSVYAAAITASTGFLPEQPEREEGDDQE
jgi:hypothetical protein